MPGVRSTKLPACLALGALLAACAGTPTSERTVLKTLRATGVESPYTNVLVVSAAGDRESRIRFERETAELISNEVTDAIPFFAVAGRYSPISRTILNNAVLAREFDAILLVRRQGQERPENAPGRPTGRGFDLYRYDYEELNDLQPISVNSTVAFIAELYDTAAARKIWAIDSLLFKTESTDAALATQIQMITSELKTDRLFAR